MNKADCEHLGYLLTQYTPGSWDLCKAIFKMDSRIEEEYDAFNEVRGISDEVDALAETLVEERLGLGWACSMSICEVEKIYRECKDEARREIYGDDYE